MKTVGSGGAPSGARPLESTSSRAMKTTKTEDLRAAEERKLELLALARRSRVKWVTDAADRPGAGSENNKSGDLQKHSPSSNSHVAVSDSRVVSLSKRRDKFPAAECIQTVLEVLSDIVDDGEVVDIDAVIALIPSDKDIDDVQSTEIPQYDGAEGPRPPYAVFIDKLKHPTAIDIVKSMQYFVMKFEQTIRNYQLQLMTEDPELLASKAAALSASVDNQFDAGDDPITVKRIASIWEFLDKTYALMKANILWAEETPTQWDKSKASCEKFLFLKLYHLIFACDVEDSHLDRKLSDRIASLSFLTGEHLDIRYIKPGSTALQGTVGVLKKLALAKCPADKLSVLKKTSVAIASALKEARSDGSLPGADEFLPMMILAIKECNPPNINSTVKFLQRYIHPSKQGSENGYLLTHFVSAVQFLENVDAQALTISPEEFDRSMAKSIASAKRSQDIAEAKSAGIYKSVLDSRKAGLSTSNRGRTCSGTVSEIYGEDDIRWQYYGPPSVVQHETDDANRLGEDNVTIGISGVNFVNSQEEPVNGHAAANQTEGHSGSAGSEAEKVKYNALLKELLAMETKFVKKDGNATSTSTTSELSPLRNLASTSGDMGWLSINSSGSSSTPMRGWQNQVPESFSAEMLNEQTKTMIALAAMHHSREQLYPGHSRLDLSQTRQGALPAVRPEFLVSGRFADASVETLTCGDMCALLAEYKVLLKACSTLTSNYR
jgi:hypothetical protein